MIFKKMNTYNDTPNTSLEIYSQIIRNKNGNCRVILANGSDESSIFNIVAERYNEYSDKCLELEKMNDIEFTEDQKKCLKGCYISKTQGLIHLLTILDAKRNDLEKSLCFYCGFGEPDTWDHYLPKELFAEFSVYPNNLLPCCPSCNRIKGVHWLDEEKKYRKLISFYYDEPIDEQILIIKLQKKQRAFSLKCQVRDDFDKGNKVLNIIYNHLITLELTDRLESRINTYFTGKRKEYIAAKENSFGDAWKKILGLKNEMLRKDFGCNYWKYAVNVAILESDEFFSE
ncbi:hypothetical protein BCH308197_3569 [Bacillus cereus H3081.97]|uniref:HNH endonuclease n=1 Tax=Bacillus paranthracis TaxID=2026186 RepID=UPI00016B8D11|nr:hypothetical protein [Bacillus paranthracis]EDZ57016.1 hypothetical protein BCH308197_3569 [Bacillus cereus H3081.97]KLA04095.1 hypothetical protein B4086_3439 [Bacillus cereus]